MRPVRSTSSACPGASAAWCSGAPSQASSPPASQIGHRRRAEQLAQVLGGLGRAVRGQPVLQVPRRERRRVEGGVGGLVDLGDEAAATRCGRGAPAGPGRRAAPWRPRRRSRWGGGSCPTHRRTLGRSGPSRLGCCRGRRHRFAQCPGRAARGARADRRGPRGVRAAALARGAAPPDPRGGRRVAGPRCPGERRPRRGDGAPRPGARRHARAPPSGRCSPTPSSSSPAAPSRPPPRASTCASLVASAPLQALARLHVAAASDLCPPSSSAGPASRREPARSSSTSGAAPTSERPA